MKRKIETEDQINKKKKDCSNNDTQSTKRQRDNSNSPKKRCREEYYDYRSEKFVAYRFDIY